ncbi:MAG TPA: hypothetical protein VIH48_01645 [Candidatus Bathyarchaeia archaeon]
MKRTLFITVALLITAFLCIQAVSAYSYSDYTAAIIKTADRLVDLQADITEDNAGNGAIDTDPDDGGWDWYLDSTATAYAGAGPSPENLYGVTAQAILEAYKISACACYLTAMIDAYTGANGYPTVDSGPDMPFLVGLSQITGNSAYAALAKTRYDTKVASYGDYNLDTVVDEKDLAEKIRDARNSQGYDGLIPWDINLFIKAALALNTYYPGQGYNQDALNMTNIIYADMTGSPGYFDPGDSTDDDYILGLSGGMEAFVSTGTHLTGTTSAESLKNTLLSYQEPTGEWNSPTYPADHIATVQDTAYAVMALVKYGGAPQILAAKKGAEWLIADQQPNGGWSGSDEYPEVDSEAAQALSAAKCAPVGGVWGSIDKFGLLAPWIGLVAITVSAATVSVAITKRRNKKQN